MSNPEYFCCFGIVGLDGLGRRGRSFYEMGEKNGRKKLPIGAIRKGWTLALRAAAGSQ